MYTSTTLDSLHNATTAATRSSIASEHASEHSQWSAPSADRDHDYMHAYEPTLQPEDEEPVASPDIVVESPARSHDPSPVEGDRLLAS